ncbi:MAG: hypothetical protein EAZ99_14650 [Alphaproteobacteria bacterium]|nr:MAG: hypothetical protein EAZ99_14650 [Alphaproteobacteria bacterium]
MTDLTRSIGAAAVSTAMAATRAATAVGEAEPDQRSEAVVRLFGLGTQAKATGLAFRESAATQRRVLDLIA